MQAFSKPMSGFGRACIIAGLVAGLAGCGSDTSTEETADGSSKPPKVAPTPVKAADLKVNVFLEYSGGMKGFVPVGSANRPATEFQQRVYSLLTETGTNGQVAGRTYQLIYQDKDIRNVSFEKMKRVVQGLETDAADGTELPEMLTAVLTRPQASQEVSVIISDFIYGPQNKAKIPFIANEIRAAVASVAQQKLAVAVLAERSTFVGKYHPAVKEPVKQRQLHGEKIPYYIWVIGPPALVGKYLGQVVKEVPAEQMYLGFGSLPITYAPMLGGFAKGSTLPPQGAHIEFGEEVDAPLVIEDFAETTFLDLSIGLDLRSLPLVWQQPAFLAQNLQAKVAGASVRLLSVRRLTMSEQEDKNLSRFSHFVRVHLEKLPVADNQFTIILPAPGIPVWAMQWNTTNDNLPGPNANTYRLNDILGGVRGAFPAVLPDVFTARLTLSNHP